MSFRRTSTEHPRIQMVSLIDLIFILLIFFIITSILIKLSKAETKLYIPTPTNEPGEAQILIQILDEDRFLWLDHTAIDTLNIYGYRLRNPMEPAAKVNLLLEKMSLDKSGLNDRVLRLKQEVRNKPSEDYFVIIRCPDNKPYYLATNVIEKFVDMPNFEYGCVSGSVDELLNSAGVTISGNVLEIDFKFDD